MYLFRLVSTKTRGGKWARFAVWSLDERWDASPLGTQSHKSISDFGTPDQDTLLIPFYFILLHSFELSFKTNRIRYFISCIMYDVKNAYFKHNFF